MLFEPFGNTLKQNERKLRELKLRYERLDQEIEQFFKELGVTHEEICAYIQEKNNFSPKEWETLKIKQKALEDRLENDLKMIRDIRASKKSFEEKGISQHWIFCK